MTVAVEAPTFRPQPGPQTQGMESEADIVIMGGAAGGGIGGEPKIIWFWDGELTKRRPRIH